MLALLARMMDALGVMLSEMGERGSSSDRWPVYAGSSGLVRSLDISLAGCRVRQPARLIASLNFSLLTALFGGMYTLVALCQPGCAVPPVGNIAV
jgi:hypothetical protein